MSTEIKTRHIGRQISKMRELFGMKQDALAFAMGISQQTVSHMENNEHIEDRKLKQVAKALGVNTEAIKNFSEEAVINYFNNFNDYSSNAGNIGNNPNFNPIEKLLEAYHEKEKLFERLLQTEKDKVAYLEKLLNK